MHNKILIACVSVISLFAGFLLCGLVSHWHYIRYSFLFVKITDVMQIATLLIIAFFVTHYVNIKTSNKINRKEAVLEIVKKFQGSIDNVYSCGYKYILDSNSGSNVEHSILAHLRSASNYLNMIQKFKKDEVQELNSFDEIYCKQKLLDLKISITDSPFKTSNHIYSPDQIISFDRNYTDLIDLIYKFRTNFWL